MAAKFDTEDLMNSILAVMTTNDALNVKIAEIEAEKAAKSQSLSPVLKTIAADSYYLQTWSDKILNTNPAILYGIEDVSGVENAGGFAKTYKIFVEIVLVDSGNQNDTHKRIARYARALEELFQKARLPEVPAAQIKVESVRPISFKLELDSDEEIKVGGISLNVTLY